MNTDEQLNNATKPTIRRLRSNYYSKLVNRYQGFKFVNVEDKIDFFNNLKEIIDDEKFTFEERSVYLQFMVGGIKLDFENARPQTESDGFQHLYNFE